MKKLLVLAACLGATAVGFGQGQFNFNNYNVPLGITALVTDSAGAGLDGGAGWVGQMYGTVDGALTAVGSPVAFSTGTRAGRINGGAVAVAGIGAATVDMQMRAWNGAEYATYEEAEAAFGAVGMSNVIPVTLGVAPATPGDLTGLEAFSVAVVPEPSTLALGLLGIGALLIRRRR